MNITLLPALQCPAQCLYDYIVRIYYMDMSYKYRIIACTTVSDWISCAMFVWIHHMTILYKYIAWVCNILSYEYIVWINCMNVLYEYTVWIYYMNALYEYTIWKCYMNMYEYIKWIYRMNIVHVWINCMDILYFMNIYCMNILYSCNISLYE